MMDVDHALETIGSLGRYQKIGVVLMNIAFLGTVVFPHTALIFMTVEPPWRCSPGSVACNHTGVFAPGDDLYDYRCTLNRSDWEFHSEYSTITTEWDLVCGDAVLWSVVISAMSPGKLLGTIIFGIVSDKYGRKKIICVCAIFNFVLTLVSGFIPWFWVYAVFRLFIGFFVGGYMMTAYVFVLEFTGVRHRNFVSHLVGGLPWTYGRCVLSLFVYLIVSWRHLNTAFALLMIPGAVVLWYFPESPHWLLLEGEQEKVMDCMRRIARVNGTKMPDVTLVLPVEKPEDSKNGTTRDLFRTKSSTKFTLSAFVIWFSLAMESYGVGFTAVKLGGNAFLNFAIIGLIVFPAPVVLIFFTSKFGRRNVIVTTLFLTSLGCGLYLATLDYDITGIVAVRVALFVMITWFDEFTWDALYLMTAEYFPTMTRNVALGWCAAVATISVFACPYVLILSQYSPYLPLAIFGSCTLISSFLTIFLRDTRDDATPETVGEMDLQHKRKYLFEGKAGMQEPTERSKEQCMSSSFAHRRSNSLIAEETKF